MSHPKKGQGRGAARLSESEEEQRGRPDPKLLRAAVTIAILSHPARMAIVLLLRESSGPMHLAELKAAVTPSSPHPAFSTMLRPLVASRLVARLQRGREASYELTAEVRARIEPLLELVTLLEPRR